MLAAIELGTRTWDKDEVQKLRTDLAASLKAHPKDARLRLAEATLLAQNGQLDEAVQSLNKAIEIDPDALNQKWLLADMLIDLKRLREAEELVNDLRKRDVRAEITDFLEARIKITREEWSAALVILERIRGLFQELPGARGQVGRIDLMLGRVYEAIGGEPDRREQAYRRALNADPESVEARLGLARTVAERGQFDEAIGLYRSLVSTNPAFLVDVARTTLLATLAVPKEKRDWRALQKAIDEATRLAGDSPVLPLIQADMLNAQGKFDQAVALLEKARAAHPEQIEPWLAIAESKAAQDKLDDAQLRLDDAQKALGDRAEIRLARARYLTRSKGKKAADEILKFSEDIEKFPAVSQRKLLTGLAVDFALLGATDQASILWKKMAALFPTDLGSLLGMFDQSLRQNDPKAMARTLEAIRAVEGKDGRWGTFCEVRMLVAQARSGDPTALERARSLVMDLSKRNPNWVAVALQLAEIAELNGEIKKAREGYAQAILMGANAPAVLRHAIELMHNAGEDAEASRLLVKLKRLGPIEGDFRRVSEEVDVKTGKATAALDSARKAVADGSKDYRDHLWLARLLWVANQKTEVEPRIRAAIAIKPDAGESWISLVDYFVATDQKEKAEATVKEAEAALSPARNPLALAISHERVGHVETAESLYKAAVAAKPDDPASLRALADFALRRRTPKDADDPLRRLAKNKTAAPGDVIWASEKLANQISESGDNIQCTEALALLDTAEKLNRDPTEEDALNFDRVKAVVLSRQPGHPRRKEAIRLLEEVSASKGAQPYDRFLLSQLLEEDGNWQLARKYLDELLPSQGKNLEYLATYARGLIRRGDVNAARPLLDKMKAIDSASFRVAETEARIRRAEDKGDAATALLEPFLKNKDDRIVLQATATLEELSQFPAAETGFRELTARSGIKSPDADLNLSMFLARRNRPGEALDVCDKLRDRASAEAIARACMYVLATSKVTNAERDRVAKILEDAFAKNPKNGMLALRLATIRDIQERYAEAEPMYRKSIELEEKPSLPLNNLAWLLAFQESKASEALQLVNRAITISGPLPDLLDTRGVVYLALQENNLALQDLESAAAASPTAPRLFHLSQAHYAAGNLSAARATYQRAVTAGLTPDKLHPLEQPSYKKIAAELDKK